MKTYKEIEYEAKTRIDSFNSKEQAAIAMLLLMAEFSFADAEYTTHFTEELALVVLNEELEIDMSDYPGIHHWIKAQKMAREL